VPSVKFADVLATPSGGLTRDGVSPSSCSTASGSSNMGPPGILSTEPDVCPADEAAADISSEATSRDLEGVRELRRQVEKALAARVFEDRRQVEKALAAQVSGESQSPIVFGDDAAERADAQRLSALREEVERLKAVQDVSEFVTNEDTGPGSLGGLFTAAQAAVGVGSVSDLPALDEWMETLQCLSSKGRINTCDADADIVAHTSCPAPQVTPMHADFSKRRFEVEQAEVSHPDCITVGIASGQDACQAELERQLDDILGEFDEIDRLHEDLATLSQTCFIND